jgi:Carboxypeptidase regulatory-like domain
MKIAFLALAVVLVASLVQAQGGITGCVTDRSGGALPGVEIVASGESGARKIVTQASGCYEFKDLEAGTYAVSATLLGFIAGKREGVAVADGRTPGSVDFALCVGPLVDILWVTFGRLDEAWKHTAVVAHVRIAGTGRVRSDCPTDDFLLSADVIEVLRNTSGQRIGKTLSFRQEYSVNEREPYEAGQEMVVFLKATREGFARLAGPAYVWLFDGDEIVNSFGQRVETGSTPRSFLARLRELAKQESGSHK